MYDIEQWKIHLLAFANYRYRNSSVCKSWCESNNVEFSEDIYNHLMELRNFSKESGNFLYEKIYLAKDNELKQKDIEDLVDYQFKNNYVLDAETNDDLLRILYIYGLVYNKKIDYSLYGVDDSNIDKALKFIKKFEITDNKIKRLKNYFETRFGYDFNNWWVTDDKITPKEKERLSYDSEEYSDDLERIIYTNEVDIQVVDAPIPKDLGEYVAYDNNDLQRLTQMAIDDYFYDLPICISTVQFTLNGGKNCTLGTTKWSTSKPKFINCCDEEQSKTPYEIKINIVLKGFDIKNTLLHEMCHVVQSLKYGWKGDEDSDTTAGHGKGFYEIGDIIGKRANLEISRYSDEYDSDMFDIGNSVFNYLKGKETYINSFFHNTYFVSKGDNLEKVINTIENFVYDFDKTENHMLYNLWYTCYILNNNKYNLSDVKSWIKENGYEDYRYKY